MNKKNYLTEETQKRLEEWDRQLLFTNPEPDESAEGFQPNEKLLGAIVGYMVRRLSKGHIPEHQIIQDALLGRVKVGSCGHLNCMFDDFMGDHVH